MYSRIRAARNILRRRTVDRIRGIWGLRRRRLKGVILTRKVLWQAMVLILTEEEDRRCLLITWTLPAIALAHIMGCRILSMASVRLGHPRIIRLLRPPDNTAHHHHHHHPTVWAIPDILLITTRRWRRTGRRTERLTVIIPAETCRRRTAPPPPSDPKDRRGI